jgi:hypothetical protein
MYDRAGQLTAAIELEARMAAQGLDHAQNSAFSRHSTVFGEFRNGLATIPHEMVDTRVP